MRLSLSGQTSLINVSVINQKPNGTVEQAENKKENSSISLVGRLDSVSISKQGKKMSMIKQLMEQKELIRQNKDHLLEKGIEDGGINQDKIEEYDELLKSIDEQIEEATKEDKDKSGTSKKNQPMTEQEAQKQKMANVISTTSNITQTEIIIAQKNKMDGEANVLKAEIKTDSPRVAQRKIDRVAEIEHRTAELLKQAGEKLSEVVDTIKNGNEDINLIEKEEKQDSGANSREQDNTRNSTESSDIK